jgi:hypothetical protein
LGLAITDRINPTLCFSPPEKFLIEFKNFSELRIFLKLKFFNKDLAFFKSFKFVELFKKILKIKFSSNKLGL